MNFICLKSINSPHKHFTTCGEEHSKMKVGDIIKYSEDVQYEILGFAETTEQASKILYPTELDQKIAICNYIHEIGNIIFQGEQNEYRF
jgi:hypothetical protein